jgi:hypothetical protein
MLEIAEKKKDLPPDTDLTCPICLENIDVDEIKNYVPNCLICNNGHRSHNACFQKFSKHECPVCKNQDMKYCKQSSGYFYAKRKGGKRRSKSKSKSRKYTKKRKGTKKTTKRKGGKKRRSDMSTENHLNNLSAIVDLM